MEEVWKTHQVLTDYQGSSLGNVRSIDRVIVCKNGKQLHLKGRTIKPQKVNDYQSFHPHLNENYYVHRFIWECFNGPIPEGLVINHKDQNGSNNSLSNLEVVTQQANLAYGDRLEKALKTRKETGVGGKPVNQYDMSGNLVKHYKSVKDAAASFGRSNTSNICANLKGRRPTAYGYVWKYA